VESFFEALKNLGAGRLAAMLATFFGLIIFFIFIAARSNAPGMTLLYGDLSVSDSTEIAAKLDTVNIPYQLSADGKQVLVPQRNVGKARMLLAQDGLPHQGSVGYEIFDQKQSFGVTSFQQNINALRALEGELARTVGAISEIRSARVHLVLPQRELFSREEQPASASVFVNLRNSASIGQEQINAIQHLVAASVPRLKPGNVAIIDQAGNLLAKGEESAAGAGVAAGTGDEMKHKYELRISRAIEDMVGRVVGYGRVRANVTADLNFDVISRNTESFDPNGQVVRSTQSTSETSTENGGANGGSPSVENNLPGLPNGGAGGNASASGSKNSRTEETTNFEITKTTENLVSESGQVKKVNVAVLVDGRYEPDDKAKKPADVKDEDWVPPKKYVARTQDELDKITALVKTAVGFDESRGDSVSVVNMPYAEGEVEGKAIKDDTKLMGFLKSELLNVAETISLSIVAVLIILLVLRPLATHIAAAPRRLEGGPTAQEEAALLASGVMPAQLSAPAGGSPMQPPSELDSMIDMSSVEGKVKASSVQKISELVTSHPNETVSVIRQWMSQET
jgi:flagellar M-ring protein FliF